MRTILALLTGIAALGVVSGQQAGISGPVEGFTFDVPTASLRAVIGSPGAASFGPALLSGLELGSVAPQRNYAVAFQSGSCVLVTSLDSGAISSAPLASITRRPDAIAWSADGSVAVLYSLSGAWLQTLSGLPANPAAGAYQDVSSLGSLAGVAVDAIGKQVAIAITGAGVYVQSSGGAFAPALQLSDPIAVSFSLDGTQLFAIDGSSMQLATLNLGSFSFQMTSLGGLANPIAVRQAAGNKLFVASGHDHLLREYDLASGQMINEVPLAFAPTGIQQFGANSYLVASRSLPGDPLWLLTNAAQPGVYFVPAIPQVIGRPRAASDASSPVASSAHEGRLR